MRAVDGPGGGVGNSVAQSGVGGVHSGVKTGIRVASISQSVSVSGVRVAVGTVQQGGVSLGLGLGLSLTLLAAISDRGVLKLIFSIQK